MLGGPKKFIGLVMDRYAAALAFQDYRTLWIASFSSGAAAWALIVARGLLVYSQSGSSLWVGGVTFAAMIPRVLVPPISGYLSDRFDRRKVVTAMYAINLAQNLVLSILVAFGVIELWHIVVLSLINGSARAAQMPASQALVPNLVPTPPPAQRDCAEPSHDARIPASRAARDYPSARHRRRGGRLLPLQRLLRYQLGPVPQAQDRVHRKSGPQAQHRQQPDGRAESTSIVLRSCGR